VPENIWEDIEKEAEKFWETTNQKLAEGETAKVELVAAKQEATTAKQGLVDIKEGTEEDATRKIKEILKSDSSNEIKEIRLNDLQDTIARTVSTQRFNEILKNTVVMMKCLEI